MGCWAQVELTGAIRQISFKRDQQLRGSHLLFISYNPSSYVAIFIYSFSFTHHPQVYYEIIIDVGRVISVLAFLSGHRDDQSSIPFQVGFLFSFSFHCQLLLTAGYQNCDDRIDVL